MISEDPETAKYSLMKFATDPYSVIPSFRRSEQTTCSAASGLRRRLILPSGTGRNDDTGILNEAEIRGFLSPSEVMMSGEVAVPECSSPMTTDRGRS